MIEYKITKVNKGMKLHTFKCKVAIRFDGYHKDIPAFEAKLRSVYGDEPWEVWSNGGDYHWKSHWSKGRWIKIEGGKVWQRPYFIGFKNEADITSAILLME